MEHNQVTVFDDGKQSLQEEFVLDSDRKPSAIDLKPLDGQATSCLDHGIYSIDGDVLTLCLAEKRPIKFGERRSILMTFQRIMDKIPSTKQ